MTREQVIDRAVTAALGCTDCTNFQSASRQIARFVEVALKEYDAENAQTIARAFGEVN